MDRRISDMTPELGHGELEISDNEIRRELTKQGVTDVSPRTFQNLKSDLQRLLYEEVRRNVGFCTSTPSTGHSSKSSSLPAAKVATPPLPALLDSHSCYSTTDKGSSGSHTNTRTCYSSTIGHSSGTQDSSLFASSSSSDFGARVMHRKVLRCRNGNAYISECSTFSGDTSTKFADNVDFGERSKENVTLAEVPSKQLRIPQRRRQPYDDEASVLCKDLPPSRWTSIASLLQSSETKVRWEKGKYKCDPVTRYHEYRRVWEKYKVPGEKSHSQLRWNVRAQMLRKDVVVTHSWRPKVES
ncbi:uncharacterized protein LOC135396798 [Ornithodoros turicata]|uniref:uncharacterized protein LOC135396798 n=1 Tax=Ornithodoros turicata TaxID=34597 RepID=UPI00313A0AD1